MVVTDEGTPAASAGTFGRLNPPLASTTVGASQVPRSVVTRYPPPIALTSVTVVPVRTGASTAAA